MATEVYEMAFVVMGAAGFAIIHLSDVASLKKMAWLKPAALVAGNGLLLWATIAVSLGQEKLGLPGWLAFIGLPLFIASLYLMLHSLYISLPFRKTYITTGLKQELVTSGLYSLVRHPWLLFYALTMVSLLFVFQTRLLLVATATWIALDVLLVIIQDRYFFSRMFPGYAAYRSTTPMFIPSKTSWNAFVSQIKNRPADTGTKTRRFPNE
jgi:protein-S-isoprenylcysteine O-methyltransferase Ste14